MRTPCGAFGTHLRAVTGKDDHVYLLAGHPPKVAVAALVNSISGVPARRL